MVINDFEKDYEALFDSTGMTRDEVAAAVGIFPTNIKRTVTARHFGNVYVKIIEALGYDIKVTYVKRMKDVKSAVKGE